MFSTMLDLKQDHNNPSLSVHDSLIVPASRAEVARDAIKVRFLAQQKVEPLLKINWPPFNLRESMQIIPWAFVSGRYVPRFPRDLFAPVYGWFTEGRHARLEG